MVISVAGASTWLSICSQWGIENICFIAILTLYPQECSILPIFTSRFETAPSFFILQVCPYFYYAVLVKDYILTFFESKKRRFLIS